MNWQQALAIAVYGLMIGIVIGIAIAHLAQWAR